MSEIRATAAAVKDAPIEQLPDGYSLYGAVPLA